MYKVLKTVILDPVVGSSIVKKHSTTYDCATAWTDIQEHYNKSMVAVIQSSSLSTFLTSYKFHLVPWKGTQSSQIIHWEEQQCPIPTPRTREIHRWTAMQLPQCGRLRRSQPQECLDQRHHFKKGNRKHYNMHLLRICPTVDPSRCIIQRLQHGAGIPPFLARDQHARLT